MTSPLSIISLLCQIHGQDPSSRAFLLFPEDEDEWCALELPPCRRRLTTPSPSPPPPLHPTIPAASQQGRLASPPHPHPRRPPAPPPQLLDPSASQQGRVAAIAAPLLPHRCLRPVRERRHWSFRSRAPMAKSDEQAKKDYADFEEKVKRTIYIDHLSPLVNAQVIKAALAQCANVVHTEFIVNYTIPYDIPAAALVELDDATQAKAAVDLMNDFPFIIGGMPRPVRATYAEPEMFRDRPPCPGLKKEFRWVKQGDQDYDGMNKLKNLMKRQEAENMALIKNQLEEEKELATRQQEVLDGNYKKYDMLENIVQNGNIKNLAHHYKVNLADD